jgi:hypothetical protein
MSAETDQPVVIGFDLSNGKDETVTMVREGGVFRHPTALETATVLWFCQDGEQTGCARLHGSQQSD